MSMNLAAHRFGLAVSSLVLATAMSIAWASPSGAVAPGVSCGDVVTSDVTLKADLVGCTDIALEVGADNVTIDLGGHILGGVGDNLGVLSDGHTGVTVTHGAIEQFGLGVLGFDSSAGAISNVRFRDIAGKAVILVGSSNNALSHNSFARIADAALGVFDGSVGNSITDSYFTQADAGVENNFADATVITRNTMTSVGSGVIVESSDGLQITDNEISHSVPDRCEGCGIGVQIYGDNILVARNTLIDSPRYGIELDDFQDEGHSPAADNRIVGNRVIGSGIGIAIGPEAGGRVLNTLILGNTVVNAASDGIQLLGPSTGLETSTLTGNRAMHNGNLGINTVPGTIDGGGNRAAGNADPAQCVNITCAP